MDAKDDSPGFEAYVAKYGTTDAWELEAMDPADLARELTKAIEQVIDIEAYNQEVRAEGADASKILAIRRQTETFFKSLCET